MVQEHEDNVHEINKAQVSLYYILTQFNLLRFLYSNICESNFSSFYVVFVSSVFLVNVLIFVPYKLLGIDVYFVQFTVCSNVCVVMMQAKTSYQLNTFLYR